MMNTTIKTTAPAEVGKRYEFTKIRAGKAEQVFTAKVTNIEDRGDFWYIGYTPDDFRVCRWGYLKIKKEGQFKAINYTLKKIRKEQSK